MNAGSARTNTRRWIFLGAIAVVFAFYVIGPGGLVQEITSGELAPDIITSTLNGAEFHLHDASGELVLLDFWASWCGPCVESIPMVNALNGELAEGYPPLRVIGVNVGEDQPTAAGAAQELGIGYMVIMDPDMSISEDYGVSGIPTFVLLDTDRTILWRQVGHADLVENIRRKVEARRAR